MNGLAIIAVVAAIIDWQLLSALLHGSAKPMKATTG